MPIALGRSRIFSLLFLLTARVLLYPLSSIPPEGSLASKFEVKCSFVLHIKWKHLTDIWKETGWWNGKRNLNSIFKDIEWFFHGVDKFPSLLRAFDYRDWICSGSLPERCRRYFELPIVNMRCYSEFRKELHSDCYIQFNIGLSRDALEKHPLLLRGCGN